jgi:hypothetical protein
VNNPTENLISRASCMVDKAGIELAIEEKRKLLVMTGKDSIEFRDRGLL